MTSRPPPWQMAHLCWNTLCNVALSPLYLLLAAGAVAITWGGLMGGARVAISNLENQYGFSGRAARLQTALLFFFYGVYAIELGILAPLGAVVCLNEMPMRRLLAQKQSHRKPVFYACAHYGNMELTGYFLAKILKKENLPGFCALAKPTGITFIDHFINKLRAHLNVESIPTTKKDTFELMSAAVKRGRSLVAVVDQKPRKGGLFIRFFKDFAAFPLHGPQHAEAHALPWLFFNSRRICPGVLELITSDPQTEEAEQRVLGMEPWQSRIYPGSPGDKETQRKMAFFCVWLEKEIKKSPAQWFWDYRKWSRRPEIS